MGFYGDRNYTLEGAKTSCEIEIESWYGGKALDVFDSVATGIARRYYCSEADQLRMINGKVANTSVSLMCGVIPAEPDTDPTYEWLLHSGAEAGKLHTDYVQFTKAISVEYSRLRTLLAGCKTVAEVDAVFAQLV